ncbi:metal-dependent hydrolase [Mycobacterium sp. NBC_00419]|uniref:metal-dependent hydrolase n=1 Tax=Mycobacterium sp. NBC_00419 TaxID=2975989 RepID=UPI002E1C9AA6
MTHLHTRKLRFGFADAEVPFLWNPSDPAFSCATNGLSFFFLAVEKMITAAVTEAMPLITDPAVAEEAQAFVRQEAQHSLAHRQHAKGLIKTHPELKETLDEVMAAYDQLTASKPLNYRLAYIADLEATFTPSFKLMLDNADTLFAPGDDRVASLFVWHFVEEVEHRSSALMIYNAVVDNPWYRMRVAPSVFTHAESVMVAMAESFNRHIPTEVRRVDAGSMFGGNRWRMTLSQRFPTLQKYPSFAPPKYGPFGKPYPNVRRRELLAALYGVARSQIPGHNPAHQKLPALAAEWLARYDAGYDVTRWYSAARNQPA